MKELLKESFELWRKKRWLKAIGKEIDRYNNLHNKTKRQYYVLSTMVNRFNEIYGEDLTLVGNK